MNERISQELDMLRLCYPDLEYREDGQWVRIPHYVLPSGLWNGEEVEVCFQIPLQYPGQAPYGFYARPKLRLKDGSLPNNYSFPVATPFGTGWGKLSWQLNPWQPADEPARGSNLLNFVRSFSDRFREGR